MKTSLLIVEKQSEWKPLNEVPDGFYMSETPNYYIVMTNVDKEKIFIYIEDHGRIFGTRRFSEQMMHPILVKPANKTIQLTISP